MDYMKQQRQRGITIRSAAISFNWKNCQINLIDTPGHIDFSGEVERSLKVLDGAVTILDGVKGVEAQTIKVWEQARRKNIPRICYVNKIDRIGGSVLQTAQSIKKRLNVVPLIMQIPIGQSDLFKGVIDLISMKEIIFEGLYGSTPRITDVSEKHPKYQELKQKRMSLIEKIADFDEGVGQLYLSETHVPAETLKKALRKILREQNQNNICPIYMGTSFKNKGVQPLLDAIIDFLPSPDEREPIKNIENEQEIRKPNKNQPLSAYVFKILYDYQMGPLAYTRIYSGQMNKKTDLFNSSTNSSEKISKIYRVRANQYVPLNDVSAGDIVAIAGLNLTKAGQTLIKAGSTKFVLDKLNLPSAIFTVPFQLETNKSANAFVQAIQKATIEDNSLIYSFDAQTGQYLLSGLGQLHLQILRDKLISQNIPVRMGKLKINYKQTVADSVRDKLKIRKELKPNVFEQFEIEIQIVPKQITSQNSDDSDKMDLSNNIQMEFERVKEFDQNWKQFLNRKVQNQKKNKGSDEDQTQQNFVARNSNKKSVRNPTPMQPMEAQLDQDNQNLALNQDNDDDNNQDQSQGDDDSHEILRNQEDNEPIYHISTLPFETLYEIYETIRVNLMYGKRNYPVVGVEVRILNGMYTKVSFNKGVANRCSTELLRSLLKKSCILLEPVMEFNLQGQQAMIQFTVKDILAKRGTISEQETDRVSGTIPASEVTGWIKELRSMGLQVQMKFKDYVEVIGIDPQKLTQNQ